MYNYYYPSEYYNNNTGLGQYQDNVGLPVNWAQQPMNFQPSYNVTQEMFQYHFKQEEDFAKAAALKQQEHQNRMEEQMYDQFLFFERLEKKEEAHAKRELRTFGIVLNYAGLLCKELIDANGKTIGLKPICHSRNVKSMIMFCDKYYDFPEILHVSWEGCTSPVLFVMEEDLDSGKVISKLQRNGCRFSGLRSDKSEMHEQIIAYLIQNASVKEIPFAHGWYKSKESWKWISENEITMMEVTK